jgi:hypothetical protein
MCVKLKNKYSKIIQAMALATTMLMASEVHADVVTMTFEGLEDFEYVSDFYNGGLGGNGSGPGSNYGVSFPRSTISYVNNGPSGAHFGGQPTPGTALSFQRYGARMNVTSGFKNTLSFYYGNPNQDSTISIYSETNGLGQLLVTLVLPRTGYVSLEGGESRFYMEYASVSFCGVAKSVDFSSMAYRGYIDDLSIFTPAVPEPESLTDINSLCDD